MTPLQQQQAAHEFALRWHDRGDEKSETSRFWLDLLGNVLGVKQPCEYIEFEHRVRMEGMGYIDALIPETRVLIEQKSRGLLDRLITQSDGTRLTPFRQAVRYAAALPYSQRPRWIVVCDFAQIRIHDMEQPDAPPEVVLVERLEEEVHRLRPLIDAGVESLRRAEEEVSVRAGRLIGRIYDLLLEQYADGASEHALRSLNMLCVRLVFCLYAEDALLLGPKDAFYHYFHRFTSVDFRDRLVDFFEVLDTPVARRDRYLDPQLAAFPYVGGGLFSDHEIEIPRFTPEIIRTLLDEASLGFDWSVISPTIFGAVFESTLNPHTRRSGGMHYTSVENIRRVIDPLFMDGLRDELAALLVGRDTPARRRALHAFQQRLAELRFFDPACGSGNFLTETYLSLRRLENEVVRACAADGDVAVLGEAFSPIRVSISQFSGIEINDFAAVVARTALWIAQSRMQRETQRLVHHVPEVFPLRTEAHIFEGNALRMDWHTVLPPAGAEHPTERGTYIIGNPPFVGYSLQTPAQKADLLAVCTDHRGHPLKAAGKMDYVAGWYRKAAERMAGTEIRAALVSTNSITQGEQPVLLWRPLIERFGVHIDFAWRTFRWDSQAQGMAHVHCVIIGFSTATNTAPRCIYEPSGDKQQVPHINAYLMAAKDVFVESRKRPICQVPEMVTGNRPADGGHLIIEAADYADFIAREPEAKPYIKRLIGAAEFINNRPRYCLWLKGVDPAVMRCLPLVRQRVEGCKTMRLGSPKAATRKSANTPWLFQEIRQPEGDYLIVPSTTSENRRYVPIGFMQRNLIATNTVLTVPSATLYHFGILTSSVHNAWMRAVGGRLEMRYRYSAEIVYNNFPWPAATPEDEKRISELGQQILKIRAQYPNASLADLYDESFMPSNLQKAYVANDRAVLKLYGLPHDATEKAIVTECFKRYGEMTE